MEYDDNIVGCKTRSDGKKYFGLFDKHIPMLKDNSAVLLYAISNFKCLKNIINKNPRSIYYICDTEAIFGLLKLYCENTKLVYLNVKDIFEIEKDMKFDCIVMNPPYSRNLHLKILAEAIKHLKDDESVCVNLSPVRWLQDPLAKYKNGSDYNKFENSICKHIKYIEVINANNAQSLFNSAQYENLAIYVCNFKGGYYYSKLMHFKCSVKQKIFEQIIVPTYLGKIKSLKDIRTPEGYPDFSRFYVILPMGHGNVGKNDYFDIISPKKEIVRNKPSNRKGTGLATANFDTENEAENFRLSLNTLFVKFCVSLIKTNIRNPYWAIPLMDDYTKPWTDEDFYKFFNITSEEQKIIEETMAKYK